MNSTSSCKGGEDEDAETGIKQAEAAAAAASAPPSGGDCLDGSKKWHPICLRVSCIMFNLLYMTLAIVALVATQKERQDLEQQQQEDDDDDDGGRIELQLALTLASVLLIAATTGLLATALFFRLLLIAANIFYTLLLMVYMPLGLGYSKEPMAVVWSFCLLIPLFLQTKMLYLLREPPNNNDRPIINPFRAHFFSSSKSDYFDGSQQCHLPCIRILAVLLNVILAVLSIVFLVDVTSEYQKQDQQQQIIESIYNYYNLPSQQTYYYQGEPTISFKLAIGLCISLLYLSMKGFLACLFLQRHILILVGIQYPLCVALYVSVGAYYNLPRLLGFGLALIVPAVLIGKLYVIAFLHPLKAEQPTDEGDDQQNDDDEDKFLSYNNNNNNNNSQRNDDAHPTTTRQLKSNHYPRSLHTPPQEDKHTNSGNNRRQSTRDATRSQNNKGQQPLKRQSTEDTTTSTNSGSRGRQRQSTGLCDDQAQKKPSPNPQQSTIPVQAQTTAVSVIDDSRSIEMVMNPIINIKALQQPPPTQKKRQQSTTTKNSSKGQLTRSNRRMAIDEDLPSPPPRTTRTRRPSSSQMKKPSKKKNETK